MVLKDVRKSSLFPRWYSQYVDSSQQYFFDMNGQHSIPGSCVVTSGPSVGAIVVGDTVVAAPTDGT